MQLSRIWPHAFSNAEVILTWVMHAPVKATITATMLTVSWNCRNLEILSYTLRPHITAFTMLLKLSSVRMISEASFATSVPAIPWKYKERTQTSAYSKLQLHRITLHRNSDC